MEFVMHVVMGSYAVLRVRSIQMEAHHDLDILGHTRYALSGSSRLVIPTRQAQQLPNWKRPFFMGLSAQYHRLQ
jgi:hypothetical protein